VSWIPGWSSVAGTAWWSGFYFWVSICALIGLGVAEIASHRYSDRKDELAAIEQEAIQRRHDEDMAHVQHDTAQAIERAAKLEKETAQAQKETAQARLEQERLKAQLAWRALTPEISAQLGTFLSQHPPGKINVQHVANDPEALYLAIQFANAFAAAKWEIQMLAVTMAGAVVFGVWVPDSPSADTATVRAALETIHVGFSTNVLPPGGMAFGGTIADAPILFIGSKPLPQQ
jgi:hypothetical protein